MVGGTGIGLHDVSRAQQVGRRNEGDVAAAAPVVGKKHGEIAGYAVGGGDMDAATYQYLARAVVDLAPGECNGGTSVGCDTATLAPADAWT